MGKHRRDSFGDKYRETRDLERNQTRGLFIRNEVSSSNNVFSSFSSFPLQVSRVAENREEKTLRSVSKKLESWPVPNLATGYGIDSIWIRRFHPLVRRLSWGE